MNRLVFSGVAAVLSVSPALARVIYVDTNATGSGSGLSWIDAHTDLAIALAVARPLDQVWIAAGHYFPPGRETPFELPPGVAVYGGFTGGESSLDQRDPEANLTVLNGDLNGDDTPGFQNRIDNARRIMDATGPGPNNRLDGLVFSGGYANNEPFFRDGGALFVDGGTLTIDRCAFIANGAENAGGAIYAINGVTLTVLDSVFLGNSTNPDSTATSGGAVVAAGATTVFERCDFSLNLALAVTAADGGAVLVSGPSARFSACTFAANVVAGDPTVGSGGAVTTVAESAIFEDCRFIGNRATAVNTAVGGAIRIAGGQVDVARCVFENNAADAPVLGYGGAIGIDNLFGTPTLRIGGSAFHGNAAYFGGSLSSLFDTATIRVVNSVVAGGEGGVTTAVHSNGPLVIRNSTIAMNTPNAAFGSSIGVRAGPTGSLRIDNSILWGNGDGPDQASQFNSANPPDIAYSCIQGWDGSLGGSGNFSADPLFADPDGFDNIPGTEDDNYRLSRFSPCIDAGDNALVPSDPLDLDGDGDLTERLPIDVYGRDRRQDDPDTADTGSGNAPIVDIGAAEFQLRSCPADLDFNGILDLSDITAFITAFTTLDAPADLDLNGLWDLADIVLFVGFFNQGCP
jgi:predicted outer membrane repeat protein